MNCADVRKYVFVYLDGEFESAEQREFESHVVSCESCRQCVQSEQQFQRDFKSMMQPVSAPPHLREQIVAGIKQESPSEAPAPEAKSLPLISWSWHFAPVALAAALVAVLMWPDSQPVQIETQNLTGSAPIYSSPSAQQFSAIPVSYSGGSEPVRNTLASYQQLKADVPAQHIAKAMRQWVSFKPTAPVTDSAEFRLVGARRVRYQGQKAVLFIYSYKEERVSILQYRGATGSGGPALQLERRGAMTAGRLQRHGNHYLVVTELDHETLSRLLSKP
jgi:anti-sigma factor (TIGR02949 family)